MKSMKKYHHRMLSVEGTLYHPLVKRCTNEPGSGQMPRQKVTRHPSIAKWASHERKLVSATAPWTAWGPVSGKVPISGYSTECYSMVASFWDWEAQTGTTDWSQGRPPFLGLEGTSPLFSPGFSPGMHLCLFLSLYGTSQTGLELNMCDFH